MPCLKLKIGDSPAIICYNRMYEFEGFLFEWGYCGPAPVRRDTLAIRVTIPPGFWDAIERFGKLSVKQRKRYEV